jgi:hypothetical protein
MSSLPLGLVRANLLLYHARLLPLDLLLLWLIRMRWYGGLYGRVESMQLLNWPRGRRSFGIGARARAIVEEGVLLGTGHDNGLFDARHGSNLLLRSAHSSAHDRSHGIAQYSLDTRDLLYLLCLLLFFLHNRIRLVVLVLQHAPHRVLVDMHHLAHWKDTHLELLRGLVEEHAVDVVAIGLGYVVADAADEFVLLDDVEARGFVLFEREEGCGRNGCGCGRWLGWLGLDLEVLRSLLGGFGCGVVLPVELEPALMLQLAVFDGRHCGDVSGCEKCSWGEVLRVRKFCAFLLVL